MRKEILLAGGVGLGAGLMYVFDPDRGRRRRAMLRDRAAHVACEAQMVLDKKAHDVSNRARGLVAEASAALRCESVTDEVLIERVRSQMGRAVSEPGNVEVLADEGHVTLRGVVPAGEIERLLRRVSGVRGVRGLESQLSVKRRHGGEHGNSSAHGKDAATHKHQSSSLPSRLLATVTGSGLAIYGARRRGVVGSVVGVIGMKMLTRGLTSSGRHAGNGTNGNGSAVE